MKLTDLGFLNPKQAGRFTDWYGLGGGGILPSLFNFCSDGPINLKFGL